MRKHTPTGFLYFISLLISSQLSADIELFNCPKPNQITVNDRNWTALVNPGSFSVGGNTYEFCPQASITFSLPKNGRCSQ